MMSQLTDDQLTDNPEQIRYVGFWLRVGAKLIDALLLMPLMIITFINFYFWKSYELQVILVLSQVLYQPFMEGIFGATLGKMAVKIKVVNAAYEKVSVSSAFGRSIPYLINGLLSIGSYYYFFQTLKRVHFKSIIDFSKLQVEPNMFTNVQTTFNFMVLIMLLGVAFHKKNQGLHDIIAQTYVVYK